MNLVSTIVLIILVLICIAIIFISKAHKSKLELKKLISEIIIASDNIDELWIKSRAYELQPKSLPTLLKLYFQPPKPISIDKSHIERFGKGQVWEYVWAQTCFALMLSIDLKNEIYLFKNIIKKNHIWYSNLALQVLCYYYIKTKESALMVYFKALVEEADMFTSLAYLNILSIIKNNSEVDQIFEIKIEKFIHLNSRLGYINCCHAFQHWYHSNPELVSMNSDILLKISMSSDNKSGLNNSLDFEFKDELKARALNLYLKICKTDKIAIDFYHNWVDMEEKGEIIEILLNEK